MDQQPIIREQRKRKAADILREFESGKKPTDLLDIYKAKNYVYKWYRFYLLLEINRTTSELMVLQRSTHLSHKKLDEVAAYLKFGKQA